MTAAYDSVGYANLSLYGLLFKEEQDNLDKIYYFLGILNSKLLNYWYVKKFATSNVAGNYISFNGIYLEQIPIIYDPNNKSVNDISNKAKQIEEIELNVTDNDKDNKIFKLLREIDDMVFDLYGLTRKEIKLIR